MYIGKNIKYLRKKKNLTVKQLAELVQKAHSTVTFWEIGRHKPDNESLLQLCKYFGVTLTQIVTEDLEETHTHAYSMVQELVEDYISPKSLYDIRNLIEKVLELETEINQLKKLKP